MNREKQKTDMLTPPDDDAFFPFSEEADRLQRYCKLPLHTGTARIDVHGDLSHPFAQAKRFIRQASGDAGADPSEEEFAASFLVPATGNCVLFMHFRR